jgi:hypothetical protein
MRNIERSFSSADRQLKTRRDIWIEKVVDKGVHRRSEEISSMVEEVLSGIKGEEISFSSDGTAIAKEILEEMSPKRISTSLINAAHGMDMQFSIESLSGTGADKLGRAFRANLENYNKELEKMSKLRLMDNLNMQMEKTAEQMEQKWAEWDRGSEEGMSTMYREAEFDVSGHYTREVVEESYVTGDKLKKQSVKAYQLLKDYDIEYRMIREEAISRIGRYEIELYFKKAMREM